MEKDSPIAQEKEGTREMKHKDLPGYSEADEFEKDRVNYIEFHVDFLQGDDRMMGFLFLL